MRVILTAILSGILLGVAVGAGIGFYSADSMPWTPELEINRGREFVQNEEQGTNSETNASDPMKKAPRVKVDEVSYDFGIIEKNPSTEKGEHPFYIENVGNADLSLADGGKGCFCTTFSISKTTVKPGDKAEILFKWDGARSGGVFNQGVRVLTNDPKAKEITFSVKGLYTAPVVTAPSELAFNNATKSSETMRTFRMYGFERNPDGTPFALKVESLELSDPEHFEVELEEDDVANLTEEEKENRLFSLATSVFNGKVTMKPGMPQGSFQEILRIRLNSEKTPILETPIHGAIMGSEVKVLGPLYDDKNSGALRLDSIRQEQGKKTNLRFLIFDPIDVNEKSVFVKSVRPDWINVSFTYPDAELQKQTKVRQVEVDVEVPAGSPQGAFMGPGKDQLGEIVFQIGEDEETAQTVVVPVRFAVVP